MMGVKLALVLLLFTCVSTAVDGITIQGLSGTKTAGGSDTLVITCRSTPADASIQHSLTLSRNVTSEFHSLVTVAKVDSEIVTKWSTEAGNFETRTSAKATGEEISGGLSLNVEVPDFECSDAGIYRCTVIGASLDFTPVDPSPSANATLSVIGKNGNISLSLKEYLEPGEYFPSTTFDDMFFKEGTILTMECQGDLSKPTSSQSTQNQNLLTWYTLLPGQTDWVRYLPPNTEDVSYRPVSGSVNSCLQRGILTLKYNVSNSDDGGTAFQCRTSSTLGGLSQSNQIRIYSDGDQNGSPMDSDTVDDDTSNAGMIAGVVVGVIVAIVLVVLLIVFLVRRKRNSGESYSAKEAPSNGRNEPPKTTPGNDKVYNVPMKERNKENEHLNPPRQENPDDYTYSQVKKVKPQRHLDPRSEGPPDGNVNKDKPKRGNDPNAPELHYAALDISTHPPQSPLEVKAKYTPTEYTEIQFKNN